MDLATVNKRFDEASQKMPLALSIRRGSEVVLHRNAGLRADGSDFDVHTSVLLYSVAKSAVALTAVVLAARGDLDLDAPVRRYWPEFGTHGKDGVTVATALSHGAGVPGWRPPMTLQGFRDLDGAVDSLADQPTWFPAGEPCEHIYSYGHLVSGIVRGRTGRHVHEVWTSDIAGPLGINLSFVPGPDIEPVRDPDGSFARSATVRADESADSGMWRPLDLCDASVANGLSADDPIIVPAVLGWAGADAVAGLFAFWAGTAGHLPGKQEVWRRSRQPVTSGTDHALGRYCEWTLGGQVEGSTWGMGGIGGCAGWHDDRTGLSFGVTGPVLGMGPAWDDLDAALMDL